MQEGIAVTILWELIENVIGVSLIDSPVFTQFFRAENEDAFVARFKELDDRECLVGFS